MNNTSAANISKELKENGTGLSTDVPSKAEGIVWCSVFSLLSVFIVAGNLLTIVLFVVNKKLRKKSLYLVINMAIADLMLGALALPQYIYSYLGSDYYQLWTGRFNYTLGYFLAIVDSVSMVASFISAAFISCERFYAIYRPFKHRTLTVRRYGVAIFIVWTLAFLEMGLTQLTISGNHYMYVWLSIGFTLTVIICGSNIAILRKFQHGSVAPQQQNRDTKNKRLTKTLMFVCILALISWLPLLILGSLETIVGVVSWRYFMIASFLNFCNSFVNPIVYALRIPEFQQALALCCVRRREAAEKENIAIRNNLPATLTPARQLRTLQTDSNRLQLKFEQEVMDIKL